MGYRGISGTLHDGRDGIRLMCEDPECEDGCEDCYELAIEDAAGATLEEKADDITNTAQSAGVAVDVVVVNDALVFTYGGG